MSHREQFATLLISLFALFIAVVIGGYITYGQLSPIEVAHNEREVGWTYEDPHA